MNIRDLADAVASEVRRINAVVAKLPKPDGGTVVSIHDKGPEMSEDEAMRLIKAAIRPRPF